MLVQSGGPEFILASVPAALILGLSCTQSAYQSPTKQSIKVVSTTGSGGSTCGSSWSHKSSNLVKDRLIILASNTASLC
jgi:fluoride ion exporter CrcB/FEX